MEVFVMDDYSGDAKGACPWTKHLRIEPLLGVLDTTLPFFRDDEILMQVEQVTDRSFMEEKSGSKLVSYNFRTQKLRDIIVHGPDR
ncbi:hypothetical protein PanWU01x14_336660, partial [Parasponia andersonii]